MGRPLTGFRYLLAAAISVKRQNIILFDRGRKFYEREKKIIPLCIFFSDFSKTFCVDKKTIFFLWPMISKKNGY